MASTRYAHAVLVNPKAEMSAPDTVARLSEIVPPEHIFVGDDEAGYGALARELAGRYRTVFTAGGDGTVNRFINHLEPQAERAPRIGILPLGAANGMANLVGAKDAFNDLRGYVMNPSADSFRLPLCEAEGVRFAFAGLGLDAAALVDYRRVVRLLARGPLHRPLSGIGGYLTAVFGLTLPRRLFHRKLQVRVENLGRPAQVVHQRADGAHVEREIPRGQVLYEGPMNALLMGTSTTFGHGFRLLPLAGIDPGRFPLRISNVAPLRLLTGLRGLHRGTFEHAALYDYLVDHIRLTFSEPVAYQLAGELMGERRELEVAMSPASVDLVRYV